MLCPIPLPGDGMGMLFFPYGRGEQDDQRIQLQPPQQHIDRQDQLAQNREVGIIGRGPHGVQAGTHVVDTGHDGGEAGVKAEIVQ